MTSIQFTGCNLHIPHKEWSGDENERQNYLEIERWAKFFHDNCLPCGVPDGGTTGQALVKESNNDCDVGWGTVGGSGGITVSGISLSGMMDIDTDGGGGNAYIDPTANPSNPTSSAGFTTTGNVPGFTGNPPGVKFTYSQLVTSVLRITQNSGFTLPNVPRTGTERQFATMHNTGGFSMWTSPLWRWTGATQLAAMPDALTVSGTAWVAFDSSHSNYNMFYSHILQDTGSTQQFQYQWTLTGIKYP